MRRLLSLLAALLLCTPLASAQVAQTGAGLPTPAASGALACSYTPITTATYNVAYTGATPNRTGGTPAYVFSNTGTLPTGMTISTITGVISGTDSTDTSQLYTGIQVKVTDATITTVNCGSSFTINVCRNTLDLTAACDSQYIGSLGS